MSVNAVNLISCQCNIFIKNSKAAFFEEKNFLRSVFVELGLTVLQIRRVRGII